MANLSAPAFNASTRVIDFADFCKHLCILCLILNNQPFFYYTTVEPGMHTEADGNNDRAPATSKGRER
jgi:hypothetical protein